MRRVLGGDDGFATLVGVSLVLALISLAGLLGWGAALIVNTHRAGVAADVAAVAGATARARGEDACAAARSFATSNAATLTRCELADAGDVLVTVTVAGRHRVARAGPL